MVMKYKLVGSLVIFLTFLCGCKSPSYHQKKYNAWSEQEARLYDIPVLINSQPVNVVSDDETKPSGFSYCAGTSLEDAVIFYEHEMERLGWQLFSKFDAEEVLLVFEKPTKISAISFRPKKNQVLVVIFSHATSLP
jgi:hypothetical protein